MLPAHFDNVDGDLSFHNVGKIFGSSKILDWFPRPELTSKLTGPALGSHYPQCTTRMTLFLSR